MRLVIQRVKSGSVTVDGKVISAIGAGLVVLVGITTSDTEEDAQTLCRKLLNIKLFDNEEGKSWTKNVREKNYQVLCVSQFTLYATLKGTKPDFHLAMNSDRSHQFYEQFLAMVRSNYSGDKIKDGEFGAKMIVNIENDGPVTIIIDSKDKRREPSNKNAAKNTPQNDKNIIDNDDEEEVIPITEKR